MKIMCVLLPHFALRCELARHREFVSRPLVIVREAGSQELVLEHSPELAKLEAEMPLQKALSICGEVEIVHADMAYYGQCFDEVLDALETKSPLVEGATLGCAYVGMDGMEALYPEDESFAAAVVAALPAVFASQMGIAPGKFPAYLAALGSPPGGCHAFASDLAACLRDFPVDVLPVSFESRSRLKSFGFHTLGELAALQLPVAQDMVELPAPSAWESMQDEYHVLGLYPGGHIMARLRPSLSQGLLLSRDIAGLKDGAPVTVAGLVIRRQRPHGKVVFITLEDECGHIPLMVFPQVYKNYEHAIKSSIILIKGRLTRREGTHNVVVSEAQALTALEKMPPSKDWR